MIRTPLGALIQVLDLVLVYPHLAEEHGDGVLLSVRMDDPTDHRFFEVVLSDANVMALLHELLGRGQDE